MKAPDIVGAMGNHVLLGGPFAVLLATVTLTDLRRRVIPNRVLALGSAAILAVLVLMSPERIALHLTTAAVAGGAFLALALTARGELGMGDVKLIAVMGLALGAHVTTALAWAIALAGIAAAAILARRGWHAGRGATLPLAPFLAFGVVAALLASP